MANLGKNNSINAFDEFYLSRVDWILLALLIYAILLLFVTTCCDSIIL